jgi:hypothetical protein
MGRLLSSAIKMQNSVAANPTLVVNFTQNFGGSVDVYKNGSLVGGVTAGTPLNVSIIAGDTFYLVITAGFLGQIEADYLINGVSQGVQFTLSTLTTTTRTASGSNAYSYNVLSSEV